MITSPVCNNRYQPTILVFPSKRSGICKMGSFAIHIALAILLAAPFPLLTSPDLEAVSRRRTEVTPLVFNDFRSAPGQMPAEQGGGIEKDVGIEIPASERILRIAEAPGLEILAELARRKGRIGFASGYDSQAGKPIQFLKCFAYPAMEIATEHCGSSDDFTAIAISGVGTVDQVRTENDIAPDLLAYALFPADFRQDLAFQAGATGVRDVTIRFTSAGFMAAPTQKHR